MQALVSDSTEEEGLLGFTQYQIEVRISEDQRRYLVLIQLLVGLMLPQYFASFLIWGAYEALGLSFW